MPGEFDYIDSLVSRLPGPPPGQVWAGDDCAVLRGGHLVATDTMVAGTHFDLKWCSAADAAWKAVAVNVSDIAAMGGIPEVVLAAVTVPAGRSDVAQGVADGLVEACQQLEVGLVGGDTTTGPVLTVTITILGTLLPGCGPVLRSGARPGDSVFVTGTLGLAGSALDELSAGRAPTAAAADRLHRPRPRVAEGQAAARGGATAMIDLSDGLAGDLGHICDGSGVGVRIEALRIPGAPSVSLDRVLYGGDDYELCLTAGDRHRLERSFVGSGLDPPTCIGTVLRAPDRQLVVEEGQVVPWPTRSWQHDLG